MSDEGDGNKEQSMVVVFSCCRVGIEWSGFGVWPCV